MKIITIFSGGKGETGKTTILSYLSLLISSVRSTLIIDMSSEGDIKSNAWKSKSTIFEGYLIK